MSTKVVTLREVRTERAKQQLDQMIAFIDEFKPFLERQVKKAEQDLKQ